MPLSSPRIQSIQRLAPVVEAKCKLSGTVERNTVINRTTVPTPSCAEVGDYQFLLFVLQTNNTPDWSVSNFGHLPGQWKVANWPSYGNSPFVLFRKIEAGHEPFSIAQYGSLYTTMSIGTDVRRGGWAYRVMITSAVSGAYSTAARYEVNLQGPFQHKPVGAVAFDFDNEIA